MNSLNNQPISATKFLFTLSAISLVVILIDQITKKMAIEIGGITHWGPFQIVFTKNDAFFLGSMNSIPLLLRTLSVSISGLFIFFISAVFIYFSFQRVRTLAVGIVLFSSGVLSNVIDRIFRGFVVDFIMLPHSSTTTSYAANLADAFQVLGYLIIIGAIIFNWKILISNELRANFIVDWVLQGRFIVMFLVCVTTVSLSFVLFFFVLMNSLIDDTKMRLLESHSDRIMFYWKTMFVCSGMIYLFYMGIFTFLAIRYSNRIAGPFFAFTRWFDKFTQTKSLMEQSQITPLKLRKSDELKSLENISAEILKIAENSKSKE